MIERCKLQEFYKACLDANPKISEAAEMPPLMTLGAIKDNPKEYY